MRVLKYVVLTLGVLVALIAAALVALMVIGPSSRPASAEKVESTPERLARGAYLVNHVTACFSCHGERDWTRYSGPVVPGTEGGPGMCIADPVETCAPNISMHPEQGIGAWTDGEILRALREGISRDGRALSPLMPYSAYRSMSDEDARSVIAYLRTLPAIDKPSRRPEVPFPMNVLTNLGPSPLEAPVAAPDPGTVAYGEYLSVIANCRTCHAEDPMTPGYHGGFEHVGPWGSVVAPNLTNHPSGLAALTREAFLARFKVFATPAGAATGPNTPMPWTHFASLTDADLGALYDFLRSVPPVDTSAPQAGR